MQPSQQLHSLIVLLQIFISFPALGHADHIAIPLRQHRDEDSVASHIARSSNPAFNAINPAEFGARHWWYGNFSIGDSANLSLAIDTASGIIGINPGRYKQSSKSIDLHETYDKSDIGYGTMLKDGCGIASFRGKGYMDTLTLPGGLVIEDQAFASLIEQSGRPQSQRLPHDGSVCSHSRCG